MKPLSKTPRALGGRLCASIALCALLGMVLAPSTWAGFNQVETFDPGSAARLAVNSTGAGGMPVGTLYADDAAYSATGTPLLNSLDEPFLWEPEGHGGNALAVDQTTGDVYTYTTTNQIKVFSVSPGGSHLIAAFGTQARPLTEDPETLKEGPEKFHNAGGLAVDASGDVYVADYKSRTPQSENSENRIMIFKPDSPGDYEHYAYAGELGFNTELLRRYFRVGVDDAGNVYAATPENIYEFAPGEPNVPACSFPTPRQVEQMTVDAQTGEVFYYDESKRVIVQLNPCNSTKEFTNRAEIVVEPRPPLGGGVEFMAFDPSVKLPANGPLPEAAVPGILYAVVNGTSDVGRIFAPSEAPPVAGSESVDSVTATTAAARAQVQSAVTNARYTFQYITAAALEANGPADPFAGASEAPAGGGELAPGAQTQSVVASLTGLAPDTQYHFRIVATSRCDAAEPAKICEAAGKGGSFRTFPAEAAGLPDHRAYELVSPVQKNGGEAIPDDPSRGTCTSCKPAILGASYPRQSSPDGDALVYEGFPFSLTAGAAVNNEYLSTRTSSGWSTATLAPTALTPSAEAGYAAFDANLDQGILYQDAPPSLAPTAPSEYTNLYSQATADSGSLTPLVTVTPPDRTAGVPGGASGTFKLTYSGASADFSRQFFAANDALTEATPLAPAAHDWGESAYNLYESHDGALRLVNVLPNGETVPGSYGVRGENKGSPKPADFSHAISDDGAVAFWSAGSGQVYARVDGETTIEVPDAAPFLTASADGTKVLLGDGHIYDLSTGETTDLTAGHGGFEGILGQSEDLSTVYFVDTAALTGEEENANHERAEDGEANLYVTREGVTTFIATLSAEADATDWSPSPAHRKAEASGSGGWLAFSSAEPLTGYDNQGPCLPADKIKAGKETYLPGPCQELFLYNASAATLTCASCDPSESGPLGESFLPQLEYGSVRSPAAQPRYLLEDGRLYFDSRDSLSPFDSNNGVEDVYEYEPPAGPGLPEGDTCKRDAGCVSLISAGRGAVDSNFLAVDATGENVFFTTRDQLVRKDVDDLLDVYDAREYGGIAGEAETEPRECIGEACQAPSAAPAEPTVGSAAFAGVGNLISPLLPASSSQVKPSAKPLTRAQKLRRALKACRKKHASRRVRCERAARKRFGPIKKPKRRNHR
jgi:hypothetical protein